MPDISMCSNSTCPLREQCYRHTAVPNEYRQSYGTFKPVIDEVLDEVECKYFMDNKKYSDA
jgi:hypothetical protein